MDDVDDAFAIYGDPEVARWLSGTPVASREEQAEKLQAIITKYEAIAHTGLGFWAAEEKSSNLVIGAALLKEITFSEGVVGDPEVEVGWHLGQAYWGEGFGTEIGHACMKRGAYLPRIIAVAYPENVRSLRIMEKCGLQEVGLSDRYYDRIVMLYEWRAAGC